MRHKLYASTKRDLVEVQCLAYTIMLALHAAFMLSGDVLAQAVLACAINECKI